jgi:hypothetical protein
VKTHNWIRRQSSLPDDHGGPIREEDLPKYCKNKTIMPCQSIPPYLCRYSNFNCCQGRRLQKCCFQGSNPQQTMLPRFVYCGVGLSSLREAWLKSCFPLSTFHLPPVFHTYIDLSATCYCLSTRLDSWLASCEFIPNYNTFYFIFLSPFPLLFLLFVVVCGLRPFRLRMRDLPHHLPRPHEDAEVARSSGLD